MGKRPDFGLKNFILLFVLFVLHFGFERAIFYFYVYLPQSKSYLIGEYEI